MTAHLEQLRLPPSDNVKETNRSEFKYHMTDWSPAGGGAGSNLDVSRCHVTGWSSAGGGAGNNLDVSRYHMTGWSPVGGDYSPQLSIRTVASCPHSLECQVSRKRHAEYTPEEYCDTEQDSSGSLSNSNKRMRLDRSTAIPSRRLENFKNENRGRFLERQRHDSTALPLLLTAQSYGSSNSDLSSIPEDQELGQELSSPPSSQGRFIRDSKDIFDIKEDWGDFASPSDPTQSSPPSTATDEGSVEPHSVWIAPELKSITSQSNSLLPTSIIKEM